MTEILFKGSYAIDDVIIQDGELVGNRLMSVPSVAGRDHIALELKTT